MVFGSLAIWLVYPHFKRAADQIGLKPLPSMGVGFIALVVGYAGFFAAAGLLLAFVILFAIVTLGGISGTLFGVGFSALALAFAVFSFLVAFGSKLVFALFLGQKLLRNASPELKGARYGALGAGRADLCAGAFDPVRGLAGGVLRDAVRAGGDVVRVPGRASDCCCGNGAGGVR